MTTSDGDDAAGRLTSVVHGGGGLGSGESFHYTLDAAGNRVATTTGSGSETYTLDALYRLTGVTYTNGDTAAYTYDAAGNRLSETVNDKLAHTYSYDDADQLVSDGVRQYSYDRAGNLVQAGSDSYAWDWTNQLTSATVNGTTSAYVYDGDGVRTSQTVAGVTSSYVWDRESGLPLLIDDGATSYLHAGGLQASVDTTNTASYPLADVLGSIRATTDASGAVTSTREYAVFGATRASSGTSGTFGFTGEQTDASTGLTFLRARYADPLTGRFLSADSVQPNAPGTQGYNRYSYAANNPTTWTDPSGHTVDDALTQTVVMYTIVGALITLGLLAVAFMPVLVGGGPVALAAGTAFSSQFLKLAILLIWVLGLILLLLTDPFDHYAGDAPLTRAGEWTADQIATAVNSFPFDPLWQCIQGAAQGYGENLLWNTVTLSVGSGLDAATAMAEGCISGGAGSGGDSGGAAGGDGVNASVAKLLAAAKAGDRNGFTKAGRSLQKKTNRSESAFAQYHCNTPGECNPIAAQIVDEILNDPGTRFVSHKVNQNGQAIQVLDVIAPDGRGIRYDAAGAFVGFREPASKP